MRDERQFRTNGIRTSPQFIYHRPSILLIFVYMLMVFSLRRISFYLFLFLFFVCAASLSLYSRRWRTVHKPISITEVAQPYWGHWWISVWPPNSIATFQKSCPMFKDLGWLSTEFNSTFYLYINPSPIPIFQ